jgi:hypothetical protein
MSGGLGRLPAPDPRDRAHLMRAFLPTGPLPASKHWAFIRSPLDQGQEGACVGFAWCHFLLAAPISTRQTDATATARALYREAQRVDEWDGEDYEGTSVRAGAKVLQSRRQLASYVWAWDAETVARYVLTQGPVIMGTDWLTGMDQPDARGFVHVTGRVRGGHAWALLGYNRTRGIFRLVNSWGAAWGPHKGRAWIAGEDMERLLETGGEACAAVEVRP